MIAKKIMKQLFFYILFAGLCLSGTLSLRAQQIHTLDECIEMALQNNIRTKNAENDLRMAEQQQKSAFTNYFPTVSASGIGYMADKGLLEMDMGGQRMSLLKNGVAGGVCASLPLFTGGQIVQGNKLAKVNVEVSRLRLSLCLEMVHEIHERIMEFRDDISLHICLLMMMDSLGEAPEGSPRS